MTRHLIPVEQSFTAWRKDPEYVRAYDTLEEDFDLAEMLIRARITAGLTQAEVAERMHVAPAVIARLECGRGTPSTRTLERFAEATGMRLKISFEPLSA